MSPRDEKERLRAQKAQQMDPWRLLVAESAASMRSVPNSSSARTPDPRAPQTSDEALLRWDELAPDELARLVGSSDDAARLERLRSADAWLRTSARRAQPAPLLTCPESEELYDFAQGPGARAVALERRAAIDRHLAACSSCEQLVATLADAPPSPLIMGGWEDVEPRAAHELGRDDHVHVAESSDERAVRPLDRSRADEVALAFRKLRSEPAREPSVAEHAEELAGLLHVEPRLPAVRRTAPKRSNVRRWTVLAAALVVAALGTWAFVASKTSTSDAAWPSEPVLRGETDTALLFPRGKLLLLPAEVPAELRASFPALFEPLRFELRAVDEASQYRVMVRAHAGGAFESGAELAQGRISGPSNELTRARDLAPGHYTWEAWATRRGLEQRLGSRDIEVRAEPGVVEALRALSSRAEPERSLAAVQLLHAAGFKNDARALARAMPQSAERDAYLETLPGR